MPTVIPQNSRIFNIDGTGNHLVVNKITYPGSSTTIELPGGLVSAAALPDSTSATAPSAAVTQGNDAGTSVDGGTQSQVVLTGGDSGVIYVVSRHLGNASGL